MMRKLMILGAGAFQVPAIIKASELGLYTIVLSKHADDPGMALADRAVLCSTTDQPEVLKIASKEKINGIMTIASELSAPTVGYVANQMGLPGIDPSVTQTISQKQMLRQFLKREKIDDMQFGVTYSLEEAETVFASMRPPVIIKPVLASGSRGVHLIDSLATLRENWEISAQESFGQKAAILEEYLRGRLLGGQLLTDNGEIKFICISDKKANDRFVPFCHIFPADISIQQEQAVKTLLSDIVKRLPYPRGAMDFDLIFTEQDPRIIELGGRLGGNGLAELASYHSGLDLIKETIRISLGDRILVPPAVHRTCCALYILSSSQSGRLKRYHSFTEIFPQFAAALLQEKHFCKPGMAVHQFTQSNYQLGHIMIRQPDRRHIEQLMEQMAEVEWVEVE
jgi:biotin carboxylase